MAENTSPAAFFRDQAKMEARVQFVLASQFDRYLTSVLHETLASRQFTSPSFYADAWTEFLGAVALAERLPPEVAQYVAEGLALSAIPDETFASAMAVFARSSEQAWSQADTEAALRAALSAESAETFLTAAAPVVQKDEDGRPIYRRTAALDVGGMNWMARMRAEARTAVTGLWSKMRQDQMEQNGVEMKRWVAHHDERTRPAHLDADGQTVPTDQSFIVDGYPMMYPGDRSAPAYLVVNCRCGIVEPEPMGQFAQQDMGEFGALDFDPQSYWDMAADGQDFTKLVNPGYLLDPDNPKYNMNCARVVQAVELRARGYDVRALPVPGGNFMADENATEYNIAAQWRNRMGSSDAFSYAVEPGQAQTQMRAQGEGARFIVSGWDEATQSGHVWNAEVRKNDQGWPTLYEVDGQTGEGRVSHLDSGDFSEVTWLRVDDKIPRDSLVQGEVAGDVKPWIEGV